MIRALRYEVNLYNTLARCLVLIGICVSGSMACAQEMIAPSPERYQRPYDDNRGVLSYSDLLDKSLNAAVKVLNIQRSKDGKPYLASSGSGVIYDADAGLIMTNDHVIADAAGLLVELHDGVLVDVELVGTDSATDLAVLRAERALQNEAQFVDTRTVSVGDVVFAVGYPRGLDRGISAGIISGLHRRGFPYEQDVPRVQDYIQTDAAINPGNSGGPLVDSRGRVVGINTFIYKQSDGLGFAIPSDVAAEMATRMLAGTMNQRLWFGVHYETLSATKALDLGLATRRGVVITKVQPDSPAHKAGLRVDDIITGAGSHRIDDNFQFVNFVLLANAGKTYPLYFVRQGSRQQSQIMLTLLDGTLPAQPSASTDTTQPAQLDFLGATLMQGAGGDIQVAQVVRASDAAVKGIQIGDRIVVFDRAVLQGLGPVQRWLDTRSNRATPVVVERDGQRITIVF